MVKRKSPESKKSEQIVVSRLELPVYQAFVKFAQIQDMSESQALCELIKLYFDGGYRRSPKHRLIEAQEKLQKLGQAKNARERS